LRFKSKTKTLEEMVTIASQYNSAYEFRMADPKLYDSMRKRVDIHDIFDEGPCQRYVTGKAIPPDWRPNPKREAFALQFYWQTAFPWASDFAEN
jgi:hypothetical protein